MKGLKSLFFAIFTPFIAFSVLLDESRNANEGGSWDGYWQRNSRK